jgi:hypothetical protein
MAVSLRFLAKAVSLRFLAKAAKETKYAKVFIKGKIHLLSKDTSLTRITKKGLGELRSLGCLGEKSKTPGPYQ